MADVIDFARVREAKDQAQRVADASAVALNALARVMDCETIEQARFVAFQTAIRVKEIMGDE